MASTAAGMFRMMDKFRTGRILQLKTCTTHNFADFTKYLTTKKLIYFGEVHSEPPIIDLQLEVVSTLVDHVRSKNGARLNVFLEHFSIEQQKLLDSFMDDELTEQDFVVRYDETGNFYVL